MEWDAELAGAFSLEGRVAAITGAASGLGREAARLFARAGAHVVVADINDEGLEGTAALVREAGGDVRMQRADVSQHEQVEAIADTAGREYGRLDCWVNSAGITLWADVIDAPAEQAGRVVAVNMMGTYWGCAVAGRVMREQGTGGSIVNISSTAGDSPVPQLSVYGMTKAGVNQLTRVCAKEFGAFGVRVNAIAPGWIDTPINASQYHDASGKADSNLREQVLHAMAALSPLGLTGVPGDIALAALYLASDASRFVTGQVLRVSGGV